MWARMQVSGRCLACEATTPANAAVTTLHCTGCGAALEVTEALWTQAVSEALDVASGLEANAVTNRRFEARGVELVAAIAAAEPTCPHCEASWTGAPTPSCSACGNEVSVRTLGEATLVGEDRALLGGQREEAPAQTVSCSGCGAALSADGSLRQLTCEHCSRETVVPDEIWRRLHAESAVAAWYLWSEGERASSLTRPIRVFGGLAADDERLYVCGSCDPAVPFGLMAVNREPLGIAWMVDLDALGKSSIRQLTLRDGELFGFTEMSRSAEVFDAATGEHLRTISAPFPVTDLAVDPDRTLIVRQVSEGLARLDPSGARVPLWPGRGCLMRLFGGGGGTDADPPRVRMVQSATGRIGMGHDGDLRVTARDHVARLGRDGSLKQSVRFQGANIAIVAPGAAADGTTWAVFRTVGGTMTVEDILAMTEALANDEEQSTSALVRVSPSGQLEVVRRSGEEELTALAVTPDGEVWLADAAGELMRLDSHGNLLWRQDTQQEG